MHHEYQDNVSLALARRVAEELPRRAEWIALARANLARWKQLNAGRGSAAAGAML